MGIDGVLTVDVVEGSAAAAAGLVGTRRDPQGRLILGDIIVGIEEEPVGSLDDLMRLLDQYKVGDTVRVVIIRHGQRMTLPVTLQALN
jgi:S1-C subfamily serine protease